MHSEIYGIPDSLKLLDDRGEVQLRKVLDGLFPPGCPLTGLPVRCDWKRRIVLLVDIYSDSDDDQLTDDDYDLILVRIESKDEATILAKGSVKDIVEHIGTMQEYKDCEN